MIEVLFKTFVFFLTVGIDALRLSLWPNFILSADVINNLFRIAGPVGSQEINSYCSDVAGQVQVHRNEYEQEPEEEERKRPRRVSKRGSALRHGSHRKPPRWRK